MLGSEWGLVRKQEVANIVGHDECPKEHIGAALLL
jgi:hypothetical protein